MNIDFTNLELSSPRPVNSAVALFANKQALDWLGNTHTASSGQLLEADGHPVPNLEAAKRRFTNQELIEAVAANAPNHLVDGWSFLSRAISSLVYRDPHAARHLAYYAQLRGALSILAFAGIGIFNGVNFSIGADSSIRNIYKSGNAINDSKRSAGTHAAVWAALSNWVEIPANAEYFFECTKIFGVSAYDAVQSLWPSAPMNQIGAKLLDAWGLDLRLGSVDHKRRNVSSYAAHSLNPISTSFQEDIEFIENFWLLVEPSGAGSFDTLDTFLLRSILWAMHEGYEQNTDYEGGAIGGRYDELAPTLSSRLSKNFLTGINEPDLPLVLQKAMIRNQDDPLSMIARALLMLRASSGFANKCFASAGFHSSGSSVRQWIDEIGLQRALWEPSEVPASLSDLWDEVNYAVQDMKVATGASSSAKSFFGQRDNGLPIVFQSERAGMWSLCP